MKDRPHKLPELIRPRQIVQHYPLESAPSHHYPTLYHSHLPHFYEDEVFQELEKTSIVEDYHPGRQFAEDYYCMDVEDAEQRMDVEEPYMHAFPQ